MSGSPENRDVSAAREQQTRSSNARGLVQTVRGPIAAGDLGVALPHEHLIITTLHPTFREPTDPNDSLLAESAVSIEILGWLQLNWAFNRDDLVLDDEKVAVDEAVRFKEAGGASMVDATSIGIGRQPESLVRIAEDSGVNIVMGSGFYVEATHPARVRDMSEAQVAEEIIHDCTLGVGESGVRAGVIGEIGTSWPIRPSEEKVLRGAAAAQRELGYALIIHPGPNHDAPLSILDILNRAGADLSRVIICHVERTIQDLPTIQRVADSGCYVEYDLFGLEVTAHFPYRELGIDIPSDAQRLAQLEALFRTGYGSHVLASHDICFKHRLSRYGGHGYDHIPRNVVPWMRQRGWSENEISQLVIENPRTALATTNP